MGILDGVRDFYNGLEAAYYDFLDGVNTHIPVYGAIDPIDKVVPSFALFIGLFALLVVMIFGGLAGVIPLGNDSLSVSVQGDDGSPVAGAGVAFSSGGKELLRAQTDALGMAKLFGVKEEQSIDVVAEKRGYLSASKTVIVSGLPATAMLLLEKESEGSATRTIRLLDGLGQPASGSFTIRFKCSNPYAPAIPDVELAPSDRGVAQASVPNNCGRLTADVLNGNSHKEQYGYSITGDDQSVYLEAVETENSVLTINVADAQGKPLNGVEVSLYKYSELLSDPNVGPIDVAYTSGGQVVFTKAAGQYIAKAYDASGSFGGATSQKITVQAGGSGSATLTLSEEIKGKVMAKATDKTSGAAIPNATFRLFYSAASLGTSEIANAKTGADGIAGINVSRDVEFKAVVSADGYQALNVGGLRISATATTVQLSKCTPSTCGSLVVKVVDQGGSPIDNSTVVLYNASTNFIAGYPNRAADINGTAKFFGVSNGNYYAFAFKEGYSGRSDAQYFTSSLSDSGAATLTVTMNVPDGEVQVSVKDADARPVPFAAISLFDARTNALIGKDLTDSNGMKSFTLKANRKVYAVVSKQDEQVFANYTTAKKPVVAATAQQFNAVLEKPSLKKSVEMESLGLYSADGKKAGNLKAGETYTARFRVRVPEELDYETMGVHLRTGTDVLMEKDPMAIGQANAPRTSQIRATRFEAEESGIEEDEYDVTVGDAKWVNLEWRAPKAGVYEAEAEVKVRNSASIGDKLPVYYRAWGVYDDGKRDRFPVDDTVTEELYSNTKSDIYQVGVVTLCDESYCFTSTITDEKNNLIESVQDTYNAGVFNPYKIQFVLQNNSETRIHNSADLRIKNADESIKFFDYTVTDAETRPTSGTLNGYEFPRFDVGDLRPKGSVRLEAEFTPQRAVNGIVNIRLVSDREIVFEKSLTILVAGQKELDAVVSPQVYLSGVQNDINVLVTDKANGVEVEGAVVRVKDKRKNVLDYSVTAKDGTAVLTLPGQKPGETLYLEIQMADYNTKVLELKVSDRLLTIAPSQLGVALNTKNKHQSEDKISVSNTAPYDLTVKSVGLGGTFRKLLDTAKIRNWLETSYKGMVIKANDKKEISLKTFLSQDALALTKRESIDAELTIVAGQFGQEWVFKVPVKIAVGLGDEVDDPACLSVSKSEWIASTSGTPKRVEFQIANNCTVGRKPVALQSLEAKVSWKSNELGEYSLNIGPDQVVLRPGYYRILLGTLKAEQSLTGILTFTPYGGVNGTGEADVVIQATNPLESEDQILQNTIKTKITSVNLKTCLGYDKERLGIKQDETGTVTVTANQICGEKVDFELKSDLKTNPKSEFSLQPGQSQVIQVFAEKNYPGQYALYILPKFGSEKKERVAKNIRVAVNQPGCWQLSKYEYDVYDSPKSQFDGFDTSNLTNSCVERPVTVKVNAKDWMDAAQDGMFWGLMSMGAVMLTNYSKGDYDWLSGKPIGPTQKAKVLDDQIAQKQKELNDINEKIKQGTASQPAAPGAQSSPDIQQLQTRKSQLQSEISGMQTQRSTILQGLTQGLANEAAAQKSTNDAAKKEIAQGVAGTGANPNYFAEYNGYQLRYDGQWYDTSGEVVTDGTKQKELDTAFQEGKTTWATAAPATGLATGEIQGRMMPAERQAITPLYDIPDSTTASDGQPYYLGMDGYWYRNTGKGNDDPKASNDTAKELDETFYGKETPVAAPQAVLVTGLAPYGSSGSGAGGSFLGGLMQGSGSGLAGSLFSGGGGVVRSLLGTSPWVGGLFGFAVGTLASYMGQEKTVEFTLMADDTTIKDLQLVNGSGPAEAEDKDIKLDVEGLAKKGGSDAPSNPQPLVSNANLISQGIETLKLTFTNITGFITSEEVPKTPYPFLKVTGVRHEYKDKTYDKKDFITESGGFLGFFDQPTIDKTKTKLTEANSKNLEQRYRLEFNSVPPQVETQQPLGLLNCQDGIRVGSTGPDALPKVKYAWMWKDVDIGQCNEDNKDGTYCDATQFSISLLQKVNELSEFVRQNGPTFQCPSPTEDEEATNTIGSFDIGVESVGVVKNGNNVEVVAQVKNTNPGIVSATATIKLRPTQGGAEIPCQPANQSVAVAAGGNTEARCTFSNVAQGFYSAVVSIAPSVSCQNCQDIAANNTLSRNLFVGNTGLQQCTPYSTSRIGDFLRATGIKNENVVKLAKFNALLMVDGYSSDFQHDFDVAQKQGFFDAKEYYLDAATGLGNYFRDTKLWTFDAYSQPDFTLPGPGTYSITIDITYKDNTWRLYNSQGNPNATITIRMEKLHGAEPDSPFYYLPLDGLVGVDSGRVGYGVNYNGDSIIIDSGKTPIRTVEIAGSSPIDNGTLTVRKSSDFKSMQVDSRGVVARLSRQNGNPALLFQPSNATPVILQITKNTGKDAYAIYEPAIGGDQTAVGEGSAIDVGQQLTQWNGIGASCRGFDDTVMAQQQFVPDTHGLSTRCALVGQNPRSKYALEFCGKPVNYGTVSYETVFYTPQGSVSQLKLVDIASDDAELITAQTKGKTVNLNGNDATPQINTLQDVFNRVKDGYVCVTGTNLNAEFFWNPKKIFEITSFQKVEEASLQACITSKNIRG